MPAWSDRPRLAPGRRLTLIARLPANERRDANGRLVSRARPAAVEVQEGLGGAAVVSDPGALRGFAADLIAAADWLEAQPPPASIEQGALL